jgi:hypothetical protein
MVTRFDGYALQFNKRSVEESRDILFFEFGMKFIAVGELGYGCMKYETCETCGTSETGRTRAELNSLPASAFSEAAVWSPLRASSDHCFISWGLCEHRDHASCLAPPVQARSLIPLGMAPAVVQLRPSSEHLLILYTSL